MCYVVFQNLLQKQVELVQTLKSVRYEFCFLIRKESVSSQKSVKFFLLGTHSNQISLGRKFFLTGIKSAKQLEHKLKKFILANGYSNVSIEYLRIQILYKEEFDDRLFLLLPTDDHVVWQDFVENVSEINVKLLDDTYSEMMLVKPESNLLIQNVANNDSVQPIETEVITELPLESWCEVGIEVVFGRRRGIICELKENTCRVKCLNVVDNEVVESGLQRACPMEGDFVKVIEGQKKGLIGKLFGKTSEGKDKYVIQSLIDGKMLIVPYNQLVKLAIDKTFI